MRALSFHLLSRDFIRSSQNPNRPVDIARFFQIDAYPARVRQHMVRLSVARPYELIANSFRQRNIDHRIAVDMSDLTAAERELHATKTMWAARHSRPRANFRFNTIAGSRD